MGLAEIWPTPAAHGKIPTESKYQKFSFPHASDSQQRRAFSQVKKILKRKYTRDKRRRREIQAIQAECLFATLREAKIHNSPFTWCSSGRSQQRNTSSKKIHNNENIFRAIRSRVQVVHKKENDKR